MTGPSEATLEKARRFLEQRRVHVLAPRPADGEVPVVVVHGDTSSYLVSARATGVQCTCGGRRLCSHAIAAQVAWHEGGYG